MKVGRVVAELEDENIYLAAIKNGKVGNTAYLALKFLPEELKVLDMLKKVYLTSIQGKRL